MTKPLFSVISLLILVPGCASTYRLVPPDGATAHQMKKDRYECLLASVGSLSSARLHRQFFANGSRATYKVTKIGFADGFNQGLQNSAAIAAGRSADTLDEINERQKEIFQTCMELKGYRLERE
jgi:hypothetical protein